MKNVKLTSEELELVVKARAKADRLKNKEKYQTELNKKTCEEHIDKWIAENLEREAKGKAYVESFFVREELDKQGFVLRIVNKKQTMERDYNATYGAEYNRLQKLSESKTYKKLKARIEDENDEYRRWDLPEKYSEVENFTDYGYATIEMSKEYSFERALICSKELVEVEKNTYDNDGKCTTTRTQKPLFTIFYNTERKGGWSSSYETQGVSVRVKTPADYSRYSRLDAYFNKGQYGNKYVYKRAKSILKNCEEVRASIEYDKESRERETQHESQSALDHEYTCKKMSELLAHKEGYTMIQDSEGEYSYTMSNGLKVELDMLSEIEWNGRPKNFRINWDSITLPNIHSSEFSQEQFDMFLMFCEEFEFGKTAKKKAKRS